MHFEKSAFRTLGLAAALPGPPPGGSPAPLVICGHRAASSAWIRPALGALPARSTIVPE